jgi:tight adherence protein B
MSALLSLLCVVMAGVLIAALVIARAHARDLKRLEGLLDAAHDRPPATTSTDMPLWLPPMLARRLVRAGWEPDRRAVMAIAGFLFLAVSAAFIAAGVLAALLTGFTLLLIGFALLEWRAARNLRALSDNMLGFLERVRQLLSVGNSLAVALARAVENSPPVVAQCLAPAIRRIANGAGVADSIARIAADLDLYELHLLATAARTNLRFGGSMTAILKNIIENIRRRTAIERELRSNTTQIRASAWVLAALPVLVASMVTLTNRDYSRWFLATDTGHTMIAYAVISQLLGVMAMRLIIRTRY